MVLKMLSEVGYRGWREPKGSRRPLYRREDDGWTPGLVVSGDVRGTIITTNRGEPGN